MSSREPEAEHGGGQEGGDRELGADRGAAQPGGQLDLTNRGHGARQTVAAGAPEEPQPGEREQEHGRPAKQPVLAIDEERNQAVGALQIAAWERGVGGRLLSQVGGVRGRTAIERLVQADVERHAEERDLDRPDREGAPPHAPERPSGHVPDDQPGGHELGADPGENPEQGEAAEPVPAARAVVEPESEQSGARERGAGGQLGIDRRGIGEERRTEAGRKRRPDRPRVGHHPQRQPVRERHRQRCDRRQEELDGSGAAERVRRGDQQREAQPVRLVQPPLGLLAVRVEVVRVEVGVGAGGVLVLDVHVPVLNQRLGREQVVGLVAAVIRVAEGAQSERCGVDAE
jgi:hypothetical protein